MSLSSIFRATNIELLKMNVNSGGVYYGSQSFVPPPRQDTSSLLASFGKLDETCLNQSWSAWEIALAQDVIERFLISHSKWWR